LHSMIHDSFLMMEAVRTFETSVDNNFTRQYIPEDNSEHHTRRRENLKSNIGIVQHCCVAKETQQCCTIPLLHDRAPTSRCHGNLTCNSMLLELMASVSMFCVLLHALRC
jgi:hypothetical protein